MYQKEKMKSVLRNPSQDLSLLMKYYNKNFEFVQVKDLVNVNEYVLC